VTITQFPPLGSGSSSAITAQISQFTGNTVDAFGRLRVSQPFTLFDSQSRFAADAAFSFATATGGTATYVANQSAVALSVTTTSGSQVLAQTYRVFPYQPGKSLLTLQTFSFAAAQANLTQRVGYYSAYNGVYLEQAGTQVSFVVRTYTSGSVNNSRFVTQANWNVDKFNGTGPSGITLDLTKTQIMFMSFEWLGVGNVQVGFIVNGVFQTAHTFQNANTQTTVYMQTATLPLRYEILTTGTTASSATLQQICGTVISEGGYEQVSFPYLARASGNGVSVANNTGLTFTPLVSIRINSSYYGTVVIPSIVNFLPTASGNYEVVLIRNATLTGATWAAGAMSGGQVDVDTAATVAVAPSVDAIAQSDFAVATNQATQNILAPTGYNFDLQLGLTASLTGNGFGASDTFTVAARGLNNSPVGAGIATLQFYNLSV
jgi:hypothetical protein